ncbi:PiggyBac transposable element-derived protein 1 [Plakobranchus ocellatus]|uniref:PiggyBac transposable element-derived protein 1 n=1 Tax=Plakobranchus ocellatus TaxID=259542 RepID=A0AAV3YYS9_9GAST|nr:PiggyBac transposable element-derived protein 1 [Plakobranchus ocellatus]
MSVVTCDAKWISVSDPTNQDGGCLNFMRSFRTQQKIKDRINNGTLLWTLWGKTIYLWQAHPLQLQAVVTQHTRWDLVQEQSGQPDLGMGGSVVMDLISVLPKEDKYSLYFDNLFTSPALLSFVKDKGYDATGTLRANRLNQCPLEGVDSMKKMKRGSTDHLLNPDENIILLRWNDNSGVTLGSTIT